MRPLDGITKFTNNYMKVVAMLELIKMKMREQRPTATQCDINCFYVGFFSNFFCTFIMFFTLRVTVASEE